MGLWRLLYITEAYCGICTLLWVDQEGTCCISNIFTVGRWLIIQKLGRILCVCILRHVREGINFDDDDGFCGLWGLLSAVYLWVFC